MSSFRAGVRKVSSPLFSSSANGALSPEKLSSRQVSDKLHELYNVQIRNELYSSQIYLAASIWLDAQDLEGMCAYARGESIEERGHALGFIDFGQKRNFPLQLLDIQLADTTTNWSTPLSVWEDLLLAERQNTESILRLADEASECNDHATLAFLHPYHMEQVDSEDCMETYVAKVRDESKTPGLLRQLDEQLGREAEVDPTPMLT